MKYLIMALLSFWIFNSVVFAATVQIPKTGQTKCYDTVGRRVGCTGTGQDADLRYGSVWQMPRFSNNGDGTLVDSLTGLIWSKDAWPALDAKSWQDALDYIKILNSGSGYLGHKDWRLPNRNELESLLNKGEPNSVNWLIGNGFDNVQAEYWSSSSAADWPQILGWSVSLTAGCVYRSQKSLPSNIWPVRGGQYSELNSWGIPQTGQTTCYDTLGNAMQSCMGTGQDGESLAGVAWPSPRFSDNGDGTQIDSLTGLIWSQNASPAGEYMSWQEALDYIENLNTGSYLGYNDWRLPNRNELESLINMEQAHTTEWLSALGFQNVKLSSYWSSSTNVDSSFAAWHVDLFYGVVNSTNKSSPAYWVWPVRSGKNTINPIVINNYATSTIKSDVSLTLTYPGAVQMQFSFDNVIWSPLKTFVSATRVQLPGGDGLKMIYVRFKDDSGVFSLSYGATITLDRKVPQSMIRINNGVSTTNSRDVMLWIGATDITSPVVDMQFSEDGNSYTEWERFTSTRSFTITTANDGMKKIYVRTRDEAGKISSPSSDTIRLDTLAPTNCKLIINSGKATTKNADITLTMSASTAVSMRISLDNGGNWGLWEPFARTKSVHLLGSGEQTVQVDFKDMAGNVTGPVSASITLIP